MALPMLAAAIPGLIQAGASLFGGKARRREQQRAQAQFDADNAAVRNFQFTNPNKNLENTAEDMTVNQQATNVQRAAQDASLSQGLDAIVAGGGGGGGATAIANAALQANQGLSADLAGQEQRIQQATATQAAANQMAEAQGEAALQSQQHGQLTANQAQSGQRLAAANAARQQATQALVSGLGSAAGGALGAMGGGGGGAAAAATPAPSDFSQFTAPGGGLGFDPSSPFSRSPLKQNGDKLTEEEKKKLTAEQIRDLKDADKRIGREAHQYRQLAELYGGSSGVSSAAKERYKKGLDEYLAGGGVDKATYDKLRSSDRDEYGEFNNPYAQARYDERLADQQAAIAEQEAFRAQQDEYWASGAGPNYNNLKNLYNLVDEKSTGGLRYNPAVKKDLQKALKKAGGHWNKIPIEDIRKFTDYTETAILGHINEDTRNEVAASLKELYGGGAPTKRKKDRPSSWESHFKRTKKLHDSLKKKSAPTKRTPFYRTKWMGTSKY